MHKDPEKYYQQLLVLFYSWRMEVQISEGHFGTYEEFYLTVTSIVDANKSRFVHHAHIQNQVLENFDNLAPLHHDCDLLNPEAKQRREDLQNIDSVEDENKL